MKPRYMYSRNALLRYKSSGKAVTTDEAAYWNKLGILNYSNPDNNTSISEVLDLSLDPPTATMATNYTPSYSRHNSPYQSSRRSAPPRYKEYPPELRYRYSRSMLKRYKNSGKTVTTKEATYWNELGVLNYSNPDNNQSISEVLELSLSPPVEGNKYAYSRDSSPYQSARRSVPPGYPPASSFSPSKFRKYRPKNQHQVRSYSTESQNDAALDPFKLNLSTTNTPEFVEWSNPSVRAKKRSKERTESDPEDVFKNPNPYIISRPGRPSPTRSSNRTIQASNNNKKSSKKINIPTKSNRFADLKTMSYKKTKLSNIHKQVTSKEIEEFDQARSQSAESLTESNQSAQAQLSKNRELDSNHAAMMLGRVSTTSNQAQRFAKPISSRLSTKNVARASSVSSIPGINRKLSRETLPNGNRYTREEWVEQIKKMQNIYLKCLVPSRKEFMQAIMLYTNLRFPQISKKKRTSDDKFEAKTISRNAFSLLSQSTDDSVSHSMRTSQTAKPSPLFKYASYPDHYPTYQKVKHH